MAVANYIIFLLSDFRTEEWLIEQKGFQRLPS
jgi:hypothetical protein